MDWGLIVTEFLIALMPVLVLAVTALVGLAAAYVRERWQAARRSRTVDELEAMAKGTVVALQQQIVDDLKDASEDGKLTEAEKVEIQRRAMLLLQSQITEGQRKVLAGLTADISTWLEQRLEDALAEHKLDVAATGGAGVLIEANPIEPAAD
jgi:type II secretory pathway pseudopilin PulG